MNLLDRIASSRRRKFHLLKFPRMKKRKIALLFSVRIPVRNEDFARWKADKLAAKLKGLGFKTFVKKKVWTTSKEDLGVWADDLADFIGSHIEVLAIRDMESWRYKQTILKDLHALKVLPEEEGIKLEAIQSLKSYIGRFLSPYDRSRYDSQDENKWLRCLEGLWKPF